MGAPMMNPGTWHVMFSINLDSDRADWVNLANFAARLQRDLAAIPGVTFTAAPNGNFNPDVRKRSLAATGQKLIDADVWINLAQRTDGGRLCTVATTAFRDAGAGDDWTIAPVAQAMGECRRPSFINAALAPNGRRSNEEAFSTVCASFEAYRGAPPQQGGIDSFLGRLAAGPVEQSNNPQQVGRSENPLRLPEGFRFPTIPGYVKWGGIALVALVGIGVVGYTVRGFAQLARETS